MTSSPNQLQELQERLEAQRRAMGAEADQQVARDRKAANDAYERKVAGLMIERLREADRRSKLPPCERMGIPEKDRRFMETGRDRHGQPWRQGEAVRALKQALARGRRAIVLVGPHQTGKSSACSRSLAHLCRRADTWLPGRFIRGADLDRLCRLPSNDMGQWVTAPVLVVDEAGHEERRDGVRNLLNARDDRDPGTWITLVTCNRPAITDTSCIYGPRIASRWLEAGLEVCAVSERMVPNGPLPV